MWGFPFKLFIDYKGTTVLIRSLQQVKGFAAKPDEEEVEVEVSNSTADGDRPRTHRREFAVYRIGNQHQQ